MNPQRDGSNNIVLLFVGPQTQLERGTGKSLSSWRLRGNSTCRNFIKQLNGCTATDTNKGQGEEDLKAIAHSDDFPWNRAGEKRRILTERCFSVTDRKLLAHDNPLKVEREQWDLNRHCQNICDGGISADEHRIDFPIKEPSSLSNKLVQWVSTEEELKSPSGERISRYCSINPPDLAGNVQLSQSLLILFVALLLMCECLGQVVQHRRHNLLSPSFIFFSFILKTLTTFHRSNKYF